MVFSSTIFLFLFLPITLIGYYNPIWKGRKFRNVFLLLASLAFYAWGEPLFIFVMILSIMINYFLGLCIDKYNDSKIIQKRYLITAICYNVALLFVFKYLSFTVKNINVVFQSQISIVNIAMPIGISFFTFQMMSYIFDLYYGKGKAQKNFINLALYISMFPQLIAGPIVRYETIAREINDRRENIEDFTNGMIRFIVGLSKKLLIANYVGFIADQIFSLNGYLSVASAWLGAITYTLQIYFDFSAYSDMAIGLGSMFGFHFLENFNYPYIAASITDFWKRWHISLSTWFRDYVYIPLGGSRISKLRSIVNLFLVWLLTGIWHGANWTFIVWGLFYFVLLLIERLFKFTKHRTWLSHIYTMFFVIIGWIIFRAESLTDAHKYMGSMFGIYTKDLIDNAFFIHFANIKWIIFFGILFSTPIVPYLKKKINNINKLAYQITSCVIVLILFSISILICIKSTYNPFIYFNF
jgi:D-alanyl-lipoteichoic acid acyltransferase DltB (MBOAT superfamily)